MLFIIYYCCVLQQQWTLLLLLLLDTVDCDRFSLCDIKLILVPRSILKMIERLYCVDLELQDLRFLLESALVKTETEIELNVAMIGHFLLSSKLRASVKTRYINKNVLQGNRVF